ncbi:glycosyltransferase family 2 protein [Nodosilinea sp. PGN35]|uniref:glycosyltransferase family 2 protein n=1 Tax=Nodosilinea sp. PGN35 TaxID=3020489 RepID=UPI0023B3287A|nr:glycosyltransferase family A protein [Nodosilinea sp. TSF1-S3]MDF0367334.1 glycosyltransferase family A protein [Nodosilinea sp. TSF1-S3]
MEQFPLVSIITPFLNAALYFEEAIESVLAQSYENWELLLVDDGSTDRSTAIAQRYAERYPEKIRYLEHKAHQNCGKSTSRNLGITKAHGEYIALLDADDVYLPQKLEKQVAILQAHPEAGMVYGPTLYWYGWTGQVGDQRRDRQASLGVKPNSCIQPPELMTLYLRNSGVVPCTCGLLVRRNLVLELGGFDESIQHMYEDQVFIAKICLSVPVFVENGCWDRYRQHQESSSFMAIRTGDYHPTRLNPVRLTFLQWLENYMISQNIQSDSLWRALRRVLWHYNHPQLAPLLLPMDSLLNRYWWRLETILNSALST